MTPLSNWLRFVLHQCLPVERSSRRSRIWAVALTAARLCPTLEGGARVSFCVRPIHSSCQRVFLNQCLYFLWLVRIRGLIVLIINPFETWASYETKYSVVHVQRRLSCIPFALPLTTMVTTCLDLFLQQLSRRSTHQWHLAVTPSPFQYRPVLV